MTDAERVALMLYVEIRFAWQVPRHTPNDIARQEYTQICQEATVFAHNKQKEILWKM